MKNEIKMYLLLLLHENNLSFAKLLHSINRPRWIPQTKHLFHLFISRDNNGLKLWYNNNMNILGHHFLTPHYKDNHCSTTKMAPPGGEIKILRSKPTFPALSHAKKFFDIFILAEDLTLHFWCTGNYLSDCPY